MRLDTALDTHTQTTHTTLVQQTLRSCEDNLAERSKLHVSSNLTVLSALYYYEISSNFNEQLRLAERVSVNTIHLVVYEREKTSNMQLFFPGAKDTLVTIRVCDIALTTALTYIQTFSSNQFEIQCDSQTDGQ